MYILNSLQSFCTPNNKEDAMQWAKIHDLLFPFFHEVCCAKLIDLCLDLYSLKYAANCRLVGFLKINNLLGSSVCSM